MARGKVRTKLQKAYPWIVLLATLASAGVSKGMAGSVVVGDLSDHNKFEKSIHRGISSRGGQANFVVEGSTQTACRKDKHTSWLGLSDTSQISSYEPATWAGGVL